MTGNSELRSSDEQLDKLLGGAYESALGLDWDLEVGDVLGASGRPGGVGSATGWESCLSRPRFSSSFSSRSRA